NRYVVSPNHRSWRRALDKVCAHGERIREVSTAFPLISSEMVKTRRTAAILSTFQCKSQICEFSPLASSRSKPGKILFQIVNLLSDVALFLCPRVFGLQFGSGRC